jgi:hypothetical protein
VITATRRKTNKRKHRVTEKERKKTLQAQPSEEKERQYIVRLFGTKSLKEETV